MCQQPSMWITTDDNVTYKLVFAKEIQEMLKHFHSFTHSCFLTIESKKKCNIWYVKYLNEYDLCYSNSIVS